MAIASPLQYHMNDLVYYLGLSVGGTLEKNISILEDMAAMATGMTVKAQPEIKADVADFATAVIFLRQRYYPAMDTNPYLVPQTRRMKIALNVVRARGYFLVDEYKLITGSLIRARLLSHFGKDRYMGELQETGAD